MSIITEPKPVCSCSASVSYKHIMQWSTASKTVLCPAALLQSVSPVAQSRPTLCDPMDCSMPGLPVHHQLPELAETHVHRVSDAIQPSHPLLSPSPPTFNLSQHQGLFQWVSSSHQGAKGLEFQLQPLQWTLQDWLVGSPCFSPVDASWQSTRLLSSIWLHWTSNTCSCKL